MTIKTSLEAIKNWIAEKFPSATCRRAWAAESSRKYIGSLDSPLISVVLANRSGANIDRETQEARLAVYIVVQKKLKGGGADINALTAEIDPLVDMMDELYEMFLSPVRIEENGFEILCRNPVHGDEAPIYLADEIFKNLFFGMLRIEVEIQTERKS